MTDYSELQESVIEGRKAEVEERTRMLVESARPAKEILQEGLLPGMAVVGQRFEDGEYFIPEMLMAARALTSGLEILKPLLADSDVQPVGVIVLGTVSGDIHDIGKNLVGIMLRGAGFEIIDAGVDVEPDRFVELAREHGAQLVGLSALLTTTMPSMRHVVKAFVASGARDHVKILVGGAPVTQDYADEIGADGYARDASAAVRVAKQLIGVK